MTRVPADAENVQRWRARVKTVTGRRGHRCLDLTVWADNARAEEVMREAVQDWRPNRPDGDLYHWARGVRASPLVARVKRQYIRAGDDHEQATRRSP